jgi:hypothetical protein
MAEAPIEVLDVGILIRLCRLDVAQLNMIAAAPVREDLREVFGVVMDANSVRSTTSLD